MDILNTQHSPLIFSLDATICPRKKAENATTRQGLRCSNRHSNNANWPITPTVLVLPSFVMLILFYSNFTLLKVPTQ